MRALISGRFDPPHCGHIRTIQKLGERFALVVVVVLDDDTEDSPAWYRMMVLRDILDSSDGHYNVISNRTHFSKITREEIESYRCDVYCGGNDEVNRHIRIGLRFPVEELKRSYGYSATAYRIGEKALREKG